MKMISLISWSLFALAPFSILNQVATIANPGDQVPVQEAKAKPGLVHYVGEVYGGGVVFSVFKGADGEEHGMIVSLNDQSSGASWGFMGKDVPGADNEGNGLRNTKDIMEAGGLSTDAAGLCDAYTSGGFDDWYLPAQDNLGSIWKNIEVINKVLNSTAGASPIGEIDYWSSTELSSTSRYSPETKANYFFFKEGNTNYGYGYVGDKSEKRHVRAIRWF